MTVTDPCQPDNPIVFANEAFLDLTEYEGPGLLGRNCRRLQGLGTDGETLGGLRNAVAEEREHTSEIVNCRKDGSAFWNQLFINPMRGKNGRVPHLLSSRVDVTRVRKAERIDAALRRSEASARLADDAGGVGTWDFERLSGALTWDDRRRASFGLPPGAAVTQVSSLDGCHPDDRPRLRAAMLAAIDGILRPRFPYGEPTFARS